MEPPCWPSSTAPPGRRGWYGASCQVGIPAGIIGAQGSFWLVSASSIAYAVGAVLGGGFAPFIAAALYERTGTSLAVSGYMVRSGWSA